MFCAISLHPMIILSSMVVLVFFITLQHHIPQSLVGAVAPREAVIEPENEQFSFFPGMSSKADASVRKFEGKAGVVSPAVEKEITETLMNLANCKVSEYFIYHYFAFNSFIVIRGQAPYLCADDGHYATVTQTPIFN